MPQCVHKCRFAGACFTDKEYILLFHHGGAKESDHILSFKQFKQRALFFSQFTVQLSPHFATDSACLNPLGTLKATKADNIL
ncbi:hypothetical protein D3C77_403280 [compost metagenome]